MPMMAATNPTMGHFGLQSICRMLPETRCVSSMFIINHRTQTGRRILERHEYQTIRVVRAGAGAEIVPNGITEAYSAECIGSADPRVGHGNYVDCNAFLIHGHGGSHLNCGPHLPHSTEPAVVISSVNQSRLQQFPQEPHRQFVNLACCFQHTRPYSYSVER